MKYRLFVNGRSKNTRDCKSDIGIGGVIINEAGEQISFSKNMGIGTCSEAQIYAVMHGIDNILKLNNATDITVYLSNLMLVEYLNGKKLQLSAGTSILANRLRGYTQNFNISINFEYFDFSEYNYVVGLAEDAINL